MDMEFHAQAHVEAQRRVVALRAEYDEMTTAERRNTRASVVH
jgi:hypothetical protein